VRAGGLDQDAQYANPRDSLVKIAASRMRQDLKPPRDYEAELLVNYPARYRERFRKSKMFKQQVESMRQMEGITTNPILEMSTGRKIVDRIEQARARYLSASLGMDAAGLAPDALSRARALRAQADALMVETPRGEALQANTPLWRALAELHAILLTGTYPPPSLPPAIDAPVLAPMMFDKDRGFVASMPPEGDGGLTPTSAEWARSVRDFTGMSGQDEAEATALAEEQRQGYAADAAKASQQLRVNAFIPFLGLVNRPISAMVKRQEARQADIDRRQNEVLAAGKVRDEAARTERAAESYAKSYQTGDQIAAIDEFRASFEPLWSPALRSAAQKAGAAPGDRIVVLPDGLASALPIGLLRDPKTGRSLIEDYEIVYAPSLAAYASSVRRAAARPSGGVAAFALPLAESGLPFVEMEAELARMTLGGQTLNTAGKQELMAGLRGASYWHFATHGVFDWSNPRNSGLILHRGERLTLSDLYFSPEPIGSPRLLVLSVCETGLFDAAQDPDAFIGLPTGFIQAGAAGVVASLWRVPDLATTLLMAKFYALYGGGERPSAALRHAQLWLKDAKVADLTAFVDALAAKGAVAKPQADALGASLRESGEERPFAHPVHWGAWVYYGA
jgi:CHAT domain-containing protein